MKRLPLSELERLKRALERFEDRFNEAYPGYAAEIGELGCDRAETIRNAGTALAHLRGWMVTRRHTRRDPYEP